MGKFKAIGTKIIIEPFKEESSSTFQLSETKLTGLGKVVSCGDACENVTDGDIVRFSTTGGAVPIKIDDKDYFYLDSERYIIYIQV
jgi:hypothetical protein